MRTFIINPISGTQNKNKIVKLIKHHFLNDEIVYTKYKGHATLLTKEALNKKRNSVIAVGGDGTVSECASKLIGTKTKLGIIPAGSGNGFALHFKISTIPKHAIKQLETAKIVQIDSCSVNNKSFVNVSGIGFDAHISNLFSRLKKRGFLNYIKLTLKELMYKPQKYTIYYQGKKKEIIAFAIVFANASQYGNGARISPKSITNDGLIDFVIIKKFPNWKIPFFINTVLQGKTHLSKHVKIIRTKEMKIYSTNPLVHLDGEPELLKNPLHIKINKKNLNLLIPNE